VKKLVFGILLGALFALPFTAMAAHAPGSNSCTPEDPIEQSVQKPYS